MVTTCEFPAISSSRGLPELYNEFDAECNHEMYYTTFEIGYQGGATGFSHINI